MEVLTADDNKVQLVPMLGSWVHPGYTVPLLDRKECIGNAKLIMSAEFEEPLTIGGQRWEQDGGRFISSDV